MNLVTSIALAILGGIFAALAAFGGIRAAWRGLGRRRGAFAALAALAAACTILAQKTSISFDRLISDAGSYATNDVLHVAATNAGAYAAFDFSGSDLLVYRRERGLTNAADWVECLPRRKYGDLPADWHVPDATNYDYLVAVDYVPPSPVHTNGVFELRGFVVPSAAAGTRSAAFATSSAKILPPTAADYAQDGLIAVWDVIERGDNPNIWPDWTGHGFDATQRQATGWSWTKDAYVGTAGNGHGFTIPLSFTSELRESVTHHTIEIVFNQTSWRRQTIFGQYEGGVALNIEGYNRTSNFRMYYSAVPDFSVPAWPQSGSTRKTVVAVCDGDYLTAYVNGIKAGQSYQPQATTIAPTLPFVIGGEHSRANMSIGGELCCVRVYSRALTPAEIVHNHTVDRLRFNLPQ